MPSRRDALAALPVAGALFGAQSESARIQLLPCGDDGGVAQAFNEGTMLAYRTGILRCANVIVPGPWFPDMARRLNEVPELGAGIHLALTSEWPNLKYRPLTSAPDLVDSMGYLPPNTRELLARRTPANERRFLAQIEAELRAQIEMGSRAVPHTGWLWPHMGTVVSTPEIRRVTEKLAAEYGLPLLGTNPGIKHLRPRPAAADAGEPAKSRIAALVSTLEALEPGDWFFITHPSVDTPEVRMLGAGPDLAERRYGDVKALASPEVRAVIEKRGIHLMTAADVKAALKAG